MKHKLLSQVSAHKRVVAIGTAIVGLFVSFAVMVTSLLGGHLSNLGDAEASLMNSRNGFDGRTYYEVDFTQGETAYSVCRELGQIPDQWATDAGVCSGLEGAKVVQSFSGDKSVTYCKGTENGECGKLPHTCLICPACRNGIDFGENGSNLYSKMYVSCKAAPGPLTGVTGTGTPSTNPGVSLPPVSSSPQMYLPFDDGTGKDVSGSNNNAGLHNGVQINGDDCFSGQCVVFDGKDDLLSLQNRLLAGATQGTVSFWVNPQFKARNQTTQLNGYIALGNQDAPGLKIYVDDQERLLVNVQSSNQAQQHVYSPVGALPDGVWKQAVVTWDGGTVKIYIDGKLVSTENSAFKLDRNGLASKRLGAPPNRMATGRNYHPQGRLDEVKMYNKAFTASQIQKLYDDDLFTAVQSSGRASAPVLDSAPFPRTGKAINACVRSNGLLSVAVRIDKSTPLPAIAWNGYKTDGQSGSIYAEDTENHSNTLVTYGAGLAPDTAVFEVATNESTPQFYSFDWDIEAQHQRALARSIAGHGIIGTVNRIYVKVGPRQGENGSFRVETIEEEVSLVQCSQQNLGEDVIGPVIDGAPIYIKGPGDVDENGKAIETYYTRVLANDATRKNGNLACAELSKMIGKTAVCKNNVEAFPFSNHALNELFRGPSITKTESVNGGKYDMWFKNPPRSHTCPLCDPNLDCGENLPDPGSPVFFTDEVPMICHVMEEKGPVQLSDPRQRKDGSGLVDFDITIEHDRPSFAQFEVSFDGGLTWQQATIHSATPSEGTADLDNGNLFQVGTTDNIDTDSTRPEIRLDFAWDSKADGLDGQDLSTIQFRVRVDDIFGNTTTETTSNFSVDNQAPTAFGPLALDLLGPTSIDVSWDPASSDPNFSFYDLRFGQDPAELFDRTGDAISASIFDQDTTSATLPGLQPLTPYAVQIWAVDEFGNAVAPGQGLLFRTLDIGDEPRVPGVGDVDVFSFDENGNLLLGADGTRASSIGAFGSGGGDGLLSHFAGGQGDGPIALGESLARDPDALHGAADQGFDAIFGELPQEVILDQLAGLDQQQGEDESEFDEFFFDEELNCFIEICDEEELRKFLEEALNEEGESELTAEERKTLDFAQFLLDQGITADFFAEALNREKATYFVVLLLLLHENITEEDINRQALDPFPDVDINSKLGKILALAKEKDIVEGYLNGFFFPKTDMIYPEAYRIFVEAARHLDPGVEPIYQEALLATQGSSDWFDKYRYVLEKHFGIETKMSYQDLSEVVPPLMFLGWLDQWF